MYVNVLCWFLPKFCKEEGHFPMLAVEYLHTYGLKLIPCTDLQSVVLWDICTLYEDILL